MNQTSEFKIAFQKDWYAQGFNGVPIYLNSATYSGFWMKQFIGFGYSQFLFRFYKGYAAMGYLNEDFVSMWESIKRKLAENPTYLAGLREKYDQQIQEDNKLFKKSETTDLDKLSSQGLLDFFKDIAQALRNAGGIAHLLDPIGIEIDKELRALISKQLPDQGTINRYYAALTTPSKLSFLSQQESDLLAIKNLTGPERKEALKAHLKKYSWIRNSYAGAIKITIDDFEQELVTHKEYNSLAETQDKQMIIVELKLDDQAQELISIADFATAWQDQRKANILKAIGYLSNIVEAVGRRLNIKIETLSYLGFLEIQSLEKLEDLSGLVVTLDERSQGTFFLMQDDIELVASGKDYRTLLIDYELATNMPLNDEIKDLHGQIANRGTASGKAVICTSLSSLHRVQEGDILIASMTRPEFMPALKKAAAIVTDEGGITCHAAIVSRELGKPCIIGTKIATKMIKNGDYVEVRANHGLVRILEAIH